MGKHYIPQFYLKGFANTRGNIWQLDKKAESSKEIPIPRVAQSADYFSEDTEQYLSLQIEQQGNAVLQTIREFLLPQATEKYLFAKYLVTLRRRVPKSRETMVEKIPSIAQEHKELSKFVLNSRLHNEPEKREKIEEKRTEINNAIERVQKEKGYQDQVYERYIAEEETLERMSEIVSRMTWFLLFRNNEPFYLTCDNPFFYHKRLGLCNPLSELTIPISKNIGLFAFPFSGPDRYIEANAKTVKEINRRTVHFSTRFIFSEQKETWVLPYIRKGQCRFENIHLLLRSTSSKI